MKTLFTTLLMAVTWAGFAQTKVTEKVSVTGQEILDLQFDFADDIVLKTWDRPEVYVEVSVTINDGVYDYIFSLSKEVTDHHIRLVMDKDMWEQVDRRETPCNFTSTINYTVYFPKSLLLEANTINGSYTLEPYGNPVQLKTISGDIDVTVPHSEGLDFKAKTISGEMYSDLEIEFPNGKDGLKQAVGMNVEGRVHSGGPLMNFETISGSIFLRKG